MWFFRANFWLWFLRMPVLIDLGKQRSLQQRQASKGDLLPVTVCLQPEQPGGGVFPNLRREAVRRRTCGNQQSHGVFCRGAGSPRRSDTKTVLLSLCRRWTRTPRLVEFLKFSLGFTFRYGYLSDQLIIVNTEWILQTVTVLRASSQERKKVFCLHWCFISIHTPECILITLFNHRVQIIWYLF